MELKVTGEYLTWAIRTSDNPHGLVEGMKTTLTRAQVDAIVAGNARIEGDNNDGYEYVEDANGAEADGCLASKHTPGPWKVLADEEKLGLHPNHSYRFIGTADFDEDANTGEIIARLTDSPNIAGNANLLAAAPDLLAACKAALTLMPTGEYTEAQEAGQEVFRIRRQIRAAIAKAQ